MLVACGSNGGYQLGLGHNRDVDQFTPVPIDSAANITRIACGGSHTLVLTDAGDVFVCGNNTHGQCLCVPSEEPITRFEPIGGRKIIDICAAWDFSIAVTRDGALIAAGKPFQAVSSSKSSTAPKRNDDARHDKKTVCSDRKDLTDATASRESFRSMFGAIVQFLVDDNVQFGRNSLCASLFHWTAVSSDGLRAFGGGSGSKGQLGKKRNRISAADPAVAVEILLSDEFPALRDLSEQQRVIVQSACLRDASLFLLGNGNVAVLGGARNGLIEAVSDLNNISSIACGWSCAFLLNDRSQILVAGRNSRWQVQGGIRTEEEPKSLRKEIAASGAVSSEAAPSEAVSSSKVGTVETVLLPRDNGLKTSKIVELPTGKIDKPASISAGSEHLMILDKNRNLRIWGWNEHGNCGRPACDFVSSDTNESVLSKVQMVQGGCATSWAVIMG